MKKGKIIVGIVLFIIGLMIAEAIRTGSTICKATVGALYEECSTDPSAVPFAGIFYMISGIGIGLVLWGLSSYKIIKKK